MEGRREAAFVMSGRAIISSEVVFTIPQDCGIGRNRRSRLPPRRGEGTGCARVKLLQIYEGTNQIQRLVIAKEIQQGN